jgi:hypothetical protein
MSQTHEQAPVDPLSVEVDIMPHFQAKMGQLLSESITRAAASQALEVRAREVIEEQSQVIHARDEEIEHLKEELQKYVDRAAEEKED